MKFDVENKYEEIDNKIKADIKKSFGQFKNIVPLNKIEIYNEISKEAEPILFSLKNRIRHTSIENQNEIIKRQVLLEVIRLAAENETYEGFRKELYAEALSWMKEAEEKGWIKPETTEGVKEKLNDDGILL